jgi:hypothetical protein
MRYYRVSPVIWQEPWDDEARLLALYLLTSPHRSTEGLFRLPSAYVQADLGWSLPKVEKTLARLEKGGFIRRDGDVVLIVNALKYQAPANPNGVKAALSAVEAVPPSTLDPIFQQLAQRFCEPLAKGLRERFPERFGKPPSPAPALTPAPEEGGLNGRVSLTAITKKLIAEGEDADRVEIAVEVLKEQLDKGNTIDRPLDYARAILRRGEVA